MGLHTVRMANQVYHMFGVKKLRILAWSVIISGTLSSCSEEPSAVQIHGETQGTTYTIILVDDIDVKKAEIDSICSVFDSSLSTYIENSVISRLNNSVELQDVSDPSGFFKECYDRSMEIYQLSEGAFDPSVFPLVEGWGFMSDMETPLSQQEVDSLLTFVSFKKGKHHSVSFSGNGIEYVKKNPGLQIGF